MSKGAEPVTWAKFHDIVFSPEVCRITALLCAAIGLVACIYAPERGVHANYFFLAVVAILIGTVEKWRRLTSRALRKTHLLDHSYDQVVRHLNACKDCRCKNFRSLVRERVGLLGQELAKMKEQS